MVLVYDVWCVVSVVGARSWYAWWMVATVSGAWRAVDDGITLATVLTGMDQLSGAVVSQKQRLPGWGQGQAEDSSPGHGN